MQFPFRAFAVGYPDIMGALSILIRYPGGIWEARTVASVPAVGETLSARGSTWQVEFVEKGAVPAITVRALRRRLARIR